MPDLIISLSQHAPEEGTYAVTVNFLDQNGAAVTPDTATWTLTDDAGNVINSRSAVNIPSLASSKTIVLSGNDLAIGPNGVKRHLLIDATYDSSLGNDLPLRAEIHFVIEGFTAVT